MASRTGSLPRNEKERLDTPPEIWTSGNRFANLPRRLDEIDAVIVVFVDAGRDRENIRIEDDVLGRKPGVLGQDLIGARANLDPALQRVGLALLVEGHHNDGGAMARTILASAMNFSMPSFIEIELTMALPCTHLRPASMTVEFRRIDHHRHARNVGLGGDEVQELDHRLLGIEQAFVHVDVDDLRARRDLIARDIERGGKIAVLDQFAEFGRARDIGALADIDEGNFVVEHERLQAREAQQRLDGFGILPRRDPFHAVGDRPDMVRRRAAAAADDIDKTRLPRTRQRARPCIRGSRHRGRTRSAAPRWDRRRRAYRRCGKVRPDGRASRGRQARS